ncbi:MAG: AAA family ATPase, partial [Solirubrobacteraceae bacterium]
MTSLRETADRRVFASVTAPEDLVRLYVPSHELAGTLGEDRPEAKIVRALATESPPQRLHIYGEAGAGKTSLILRALADVARRRTLDRPVHPLFVNTGDSPDEMDNPQHFMRMILGLIQVNGGAFASVDPARLLDATAELTTYTPTGVTHRASITAPVFSYQASVREAFATRTFGRDPGRVRNDFEDVLHAVTRDYRAVIVIDDTDHFATSGPSGKLDEQAIANLYHHGVRTLAEFDQLDVLVAVQPRFRQVEPVAEVESRFNFRQVHVATLPSGHDDLGLSRVLARRLVDAQIDVPVDDLIEPSALAQLQGVY